MGPKSFFPKVSGSDYVYSLRVPMLYYFAVQINIPMRINAAFETFTSILLTLSRISSDSVGIQKIFKKSIKIKISRSLILFSQFSSKLNFRFFIPIKFINHYCIISCDIITLFRITLALNKFMCFI